MRKVINVSLPEHLYYEVEQDVKRGRYGTKSELFRELLRAWKEGGIQNAGRRFDAKGLLKNVHKHTGVGGPKDLSAKHDLYLYGG
jgi:Arc/MetJ-type ribon-helix-helix transcriptional regulator